MKVYVSELPKYCYCCPFYDENVVCGNPCLFVENKETCPLKSLADYTKQVKNEVVQELKDICNKSLYMNRHNSIDKETLFKVLDQLKEDRQ